MNLVVRVPRRAQLKFGRLANLRESFGGAERFGSAAQRYCAHFCTKNLKKPVMLAEMGVGGREKRRSTISLKALGAVTQVYCDLI